MSIALAEAFTERLAPTSPSPSLKVCRSVCTPSGLLLTTTWTTSPFMSKPRWETIGLFTYDQHTDGSGVAYSTRQRPILNMRPGFRHWLSPSLWQFNADLHRRPASRAQ